MTLDNFVEKVMLENGIDLEDKEGIIRGIKENARKMAKDGWACIDDKTVAKWVLGPNTKTDAKTYDEFRKADEERLREANQENRKPVSKPAGRSEEEYGQIALF